MEFYRIIYRNVFAYEYAYESPHIATYFIKKSSNGRRNIAYKGGLFLLLLVNIFKIFSMFSDILLRSSFLVDKKSIVLGNSCK